MKGVFKMNELIKIEVVENERRVDGRELYLFLEIKSRFNDWINNSIKDFDFIENQDYKSFTKNLVSGGKTKEYQLSLDMAKELSMLARNNKGKQARKYFIECEKKLKASLPQSLPEALRLYADEVEKKEQALLERNEAVRTKAEIGSRREATSMATASKFSKENKKLKVELDKSLDYATVKKMQIIYHGMKFDWRQLTKVVRDMQSEVDYELSIKVPDVNYGAVNSYHKEVWFEAYALDIK